jgi:multidrug efflux pump subunit AcrA (membrane-fusion protein)
MLRLCVGVTALAVVAGCSTAAPTLVPIATPTLATSTAGQSSSSSSSSGLVTASGEVEPAHKADLGFAATGQVDVVSVKVGDRVQAGQTLVQLKGREHLDADVANAQKQVAAAQQETEAAQQALAGAQREVVDAHKAITDMVDSTATALALNQAQMNIADLQKQVEDSKRNLGYLNAPNLKYYQDQVKQAQDALTNAQQNATLVDVGQLQVQLRAAQQLLETATNVYNNAKDGFADCPSCNKVWAYDRMISWDDAVNLFADATSQVQQLQTQIDQAQRGTAQGVSAAQDNLKQATDHLNYYLKGPDAIRVEQAQANLGLLQAQLAKAQSDADKLKANNGVDPDKLKAAQDRVTTAEEAVAAAQTRIATAQASLPAAQANLVAAQAVLDSLTLTAPFSGVVVSLDIGPGEVVVPGQVLLRLGDLDHLQVETTDLSETDIQQVKVGQSADIYVEALRSTVKGQVIRIASDSTKLGGDVVYAVTLQLAQQPAGLRWGMSVKVTINSQ